MVMRRKDLGPRKALQNLRKICAKFVHISRICLKNPRLNFSSRGQLKARAFSAAEIRA